MLKIVNKVVLATFGAISILILLGYVALAAICNVVLTIVARSFSRVGFWRFGIAFSVVPIAMLHCVTCALSHLLGFSPTIAEASQNFVLPELKEWAGHRAKINWTKLIAEDGKDIYRGL